MIHVKIKHNYSSKNRDLPSLLEVLVLIITLLANRLNLNSKDSSKPPSTDPNREKTSKTNKAGGQNSYVGKTLKKIKTPGKVQIINIDCSTLPPGEYTEVGYEIRQVFDIEISRIVTEYQAQVLENVKGKK